MKELKVVSNCSCGCEEERVKKEETIKKQDESCCGSDCNCGDEQKLSKDEVVIDFLYLDLSQCERCQGADNNLEKAIKDVKNVLKAAGKEVVLNKINITNEELAEKYRFVSSPTIRVNGIDILDEVTEDNCESCGDLCGDEVDCRTWSYKGSKYTEPPKELIVESVLERVYGDKKNEISEKEYVMPENLKKFFDGLKK